MAPKAKAAAPKFATPEEEAAARHAINYSASISDIKDDIPALCACIVSLQRLHLYIYYVELACSPFVCS